ncbi:MAG: acyl-CoA dehydrogenase, partial [Thermodesulfobacteriota bacterium]
IIGGPDMAGNGWRMLMDCLSVGRSISLPALSAGSSKLASRAIGAYSRIRKQFKMSIGRFEGVEELLSRIGGYTYMIDAARIMTTGAVDLDEKPSVASAIVKYHLTEMTRKVINDAMDIQGGAAICMGPGNLLARTYQSMPISITVEGANLLTRNMIIFGQGAIRCHPFFLREIKAVADDNAKEFDRAIFGHIGHVIRNAVRSLLLGITCSRIAHVPGSQYSRPYFKQMSRMSAAFAFAADISLIVLGAALKRKERLSARLSDILSNLYLMSAALKRFEGQGHPEEDLPLLNWACQNSLYVIQESFDGLFKNFPNPYIARALKTIIFPFGRSYFPPGDKLGHEVADLLMLPSKARDRLTEGIFLPSDTKEPLGLIEETLKKVVAAESVEKKIRQAISNKVLKKSIPDNEVEDALKDNIINEEEAILVRDALQARRKVISVDDFPKDRWNREK